MAEYRIDLVGGAGGEFGTLLTRVEEKGCNVEFTYRGKSLKTEAARETHAAWKQTLTLARACKSLTG
jgi:hypothetical protein